MNELEIIDKVINTLSGNTKCKIRYASELDNFRNRKSQAESNKYRLGVIGVTSSGKSTMINSLLGEFLLPAVARPSSSQLVTCYYSKTRCSKIHFQNGSTKIFSGNSLNQKVIEKYGDEGSNKNNIEKVKQIELSTPDFPFDSSILLIDSPGLDAYGYAGHEQLTMNSLLPTIDFCIFVTTCKTNSDEKMLSVLNTIAEYEKPVIIVQNMIDSLKPSLDGKKSVSDVAQDHRVRVERIVNNSKIKDKSKVHIVQISAINALKARQNKLRTKDDVKLLEQSNYQKLVSVVNTAFNQVRPVVEGHRMMFLKKEILRIAKAAIEDGSAAQEIIPTFQYENVANEYSRNKKNCFNKIEKEVNKLQNEVSAINCKYDFDEFDIKDIKSQVVGCENTICLQLRKINDSIINLCTQLNIDSRSILTDFRFEKTNIYLKTKRVKIKEGYTIKGETHFTLNPFKMTGFLTRKDPDRYIPPVYDNVTDVNASIEIAKKYVNNSIRVIRQTLERWEKSIESTEEKLNKELKNRRSEYEARRNKALDAQAYIKIGKDLQRIAESIKDIQVSNTRVNSTHTDVKDVPSFNIHVKKELLPMYRLSDILRIKIHNDIFRCVSNQTTQKVVIGWDEYCESKFLKYAFDLNIPPSTFVQGNRVVGNSIQLYHKPTQPLQPLRVSNKTVYVLVNATQIGAALNEISRLKIYGFLNHKDILYLVIQDFNEIINGNSVSESFDNIIALKQNRDLKLSTISCQILLLHDNPIYNLAAAEAQSVGCATQYDEIKILNDLQKRFGFLLPKDKSIRNIVETTIRIIIQKLG